MFTREFVAAWSDMDFNAHMANTRFLSLCGDVRMMFFAEHGVTADVFIQQRIGPVVMSDAIRYYNEVHLGQTIRVTLALSGLSEDGSRFRFRNEFFTGDDRAAVITSTGGWLDIETRKLRIPPPELFDVISTLDHSDEFKVLPSSNRS